MNLRTYALCGAGGMGKTQITIEFFYQRKGEFDAAFWVNADELSKLSQSFNDIAIRLGLVVLDSLDARDHILTRDLVLGWLAKSMKSYKHLDKMNEKASWLLVFDNADNPEILNSFWPIHFSGSVLITSRDPLAKTYIYSQGGRMVLPPLKAQEATRFLLGTTGRTNDLDEHDSGDAVAKVLGGIPLVISQMAEVIARRDLSFNDFLAFYNAERVSTNLFKLQISQPNADTGYEHTIASVWALDSLKKGSVLLKVLALLDADGIPEYILEDNKASHNLSDYPQDTTSYQEARAELLQSSLISRERNTKKIDIHRLIQDTARAKMSDSRFDENFSLTFCLVSAVWPYVEFGFGNEL